MTYVKICGITTVDDACTAAEAGADLLGFIFYPKSPRCVAPEMAALIAGVVRGAYGERSPRFVGVFVNEQAARVRALLDAIGLDLAQLHGDEPPATIRQLAPHAFKAIRPRTQEQARAALDAYRGTIPDDARLPQLLVDAYHPQQRGGTGRAADPGLACWLARRARLLLAGGLTPDNVGRAVLEIRPWGVDVSTGVERRPGTKDSARIRAFIQAVRAVENPSSARSHEPTTRGLDASSIPRSRESVTHGPDASSIPRSRESVTRGPAT
jgi:phosphoribosylanthranilate isomerase